MKSGPVRARHFSPYHPGLFEEQSERLRIHFLLLSLLGIVTGVVGGLVAEGLLHAIDFLTDLLFYQQVTFAYLPPHGAQHHWWLLFLPAAGGLLVGLLINYFSPEIKGGGGIPEAMSVLLTPRSTVEPRAGFLKPLGAVIMVGTGGPFGAEGPIIQTAAALGSTLSHVFPSSLSERRTLLACGAAAGLAAVFKTPFAGVMIAIELLVFKFRFRSFIPIALASATGTLVAMAFRGAQPVFPLDTNYHFHAGELPFLVLLGVCCAALAWLMTRTMDVCEGFFFQKLKIWFPLIPALGGLCVGIVALFFPTVLGSGYSIIADLLNKPHPLHVLVGIGLTKMGVFSLAVASGGLGGTFAPVVMIGGSLGAAFGKLVHLLVPGSSSIGLYGMVASAALLGSIYRTTPGAIIFMLEVTGAYNAFLPVFLVAIVADLAVHYFMRTPFTTERLLRRWTLNSKIYAEDRMSLLRVCDVMNPDVDTVRGSARVGELLPNLPHQSVPVVDDHNRLLGLLLRNDLISADPAAPAVSLLHRQYPVVYADEIVHDVASRFVQQGIGRCPVLERETGELVGMLTSFDLLKAKDWKHEQDMPEPGRLWGLALARFAPQRQKEGL